jgi:hypothetical protein
MSHDGDVQVAAAGTERFGLSGRYRGHQCGPTPCREQRYPASVSMDTCHSRTAASRSSAYAATPAGECPAGFGSASLQSTKIPAHDTLMT